MTTCVHPTEQTFREAIIANPSEETLRFALADWLEEQGRPEAAGRVRETVRIRPEDGGKDSWWLWSPFIQDGDTFILSVTGPYTTNGEIAPGWLCLAMKGKGPHADTNWPTESLGMAAILDAILEGRRCGEVLRLITTQF